MVLKFLMHFHQVIFLCLDILNLRVVLTVPIFFHHASGSGRHLIFSSLYVTLTSLVVSKFVVYTVNRDIFASSEEVHLSEAVEQLVSDLADKSVVILVLHVDDELPVAVLQGLCDCLDVLDFDGTFELVGLHIC